MDGIQNPVRAKYFILVQTVFGANQASCKKKMCTASFPGGKEAGNRRHDAPHLGPSLSTGRGVLCLEYHVTWSHLH
jgi:hypothetical protein